MTKKDLILTIIALSMLVVCLVLTSCVTDKKVKKYAIDNPKILDELCPHRDTLIKTITTIHTDTVVHEIENDNSYLLELISQAKDLDTQQKIDSIIKACKSTVKYITIYKNKTDSIIVFKDRIEYKEIVKEKPVGKGWIIAFWISTGTLLLLIVGYILGRRKRL